MTWRAAESIKVLLAEVNTLFPGRDKRTDGVISGYPGSVSSHQVNSAGVVCAVDITVGDYPNGITPTQASVLAESIRHELKVAPRGIYAYVIYNRRMARSTHDWEWEPYTGTSPHTDHIHVSVDWDIPEGGKRSGQCPYDMTDSWNLRGPSMVTTTLPTSRPVTQDWNQDFNNLNGRYYPNGFYASIGWKGHNGIDYGCWEGDPVEAVCDGVIDFAGPGNNHPLLTGGGNAILLRNDALGVKFEYLHLSRFEVTQGQHVKVGQVIARSGNTGISSAPHLHVGALPIHGVNVDNGYRGRIDPTPYLYGSLNPEFAGSGAVGPAGTITPVQEDDDMALSIEDKAWIGTKMYEVLQDPNTLKELRIGIMNGTTLRNIQVAASDAILPPLQQHAQALFNAIKAVPGVDSAALEPIMDAYIKKIEDITLEVTVKDLGK